MKQEAQDRLAEAMMLAVADGYRDDARGFGPGRFEGEPFYVAYYYDAMLNGFADDSLYHGESLVGDLFMIDADSPEREAFELAADTVAVLLTASEQGFVGVVELNADELAAEQEYAESTEDQEST